jgi:hypothetical protein
VNRGEGTRSFSWKNRGKQLFRFTAFSSPMLATCSSPFEMIEKIDAKIDRSRVFVMCFDDFKFGFEF